MSLTSGFAALAIKNETSPVVQSDIGTATYSNSTRQYAYSTAAAISLAKLSYPRCHLLGLPIEIRHVIWKIISGVVLGNSPPTCSRKSKDDYSGLVLSCRQLYHEVSGFWYRHVVSWSRVHGLLETPFNRTTVKCYRSLSIELRLDAHPGYFTGLAAVLWKCQPYLRDLRLYFVGLDKYGQKVYAHGCGSFDPMIKRSKLPIDGQLTTELLPLWKRISHLSQLEVLVISNPNFQLFEPILLINKPYLEYLTLSTDPRSIAHRQHSLHDLGFLLTADPPKDQYPPVRVLHIAANATISSNALAAKLAETLEHLTWVVPDSAMQLGGINTRWYRRTAELFLSLRLKGIKLQTLRICIDGAGLYEDSHYSLLLSGIKLHLPELKSLTQFEFHAKSKSYWLGKEIVARLPNGLEDLYITDHVLHPTDFLHQIWDRYLAATSNTTYSNGPLDVAYLKTDSKEEEVQTERNVGSENLPHSGDEGPWYVARGPHPMYDIQHRTSHTRSVLGYADQVICRHKSDTDRITLPAYFDDCCYIRAYRDLASQNQFVGESYHRYDYIPFHTGKLRFVHYEYNAEDLDSTRNLVPTALFTALLVNGRLLDKERNKHLAKYDRGQFIPPNWIAQDAEFDTHTESAMRSTHLPYSMLLHQLYEVEHLSPRHVKQSLGELEDSLGCRDDNHYFGQEHDAAKVFHNEKVARVEELPLYRYPMEEAVQVDGKCHWMCPDATFACMAEREKAQKTWQ